MSRTGIWLALFALVLFFAFGGPASAQEETIEETTETTSLRETAEESGGQQEEQGDEESEQGEDSAARDQYDNGDASPTSSGLEEVCPSATEIATLDANSDSPRFTLQGDYLLIRVEYDDERDGVGVGFTIYDERDRFVDSVSTGEESGTYDLRSNLQPGEYFVEPLSFLGSYSATIYDCSSGGGGGGGSAGEVVEVEEEVIVETIPDKILANTGGLSLLLPASAALVCAGLLGFGYVSRRR